MSKLSRTDKQLTIERLNPIFQLGNDLKILEKKRNTLRKIVKSIF